MREAWRYIFSKFESSFLLQAIKFFLSTRAFFVPFRTNIIMYNRERIIKIDKKEKYGILMCFLAKDEWIIYMIFIYQAWSGFMSILSTFLLSMSSGNYSKLILKRHFEYLFKLSKVLLLFQKEKFHTHASFLYHYSKRKPIKTTYFLTKQRENILPTVPRK